MSKLSKAWHILRNDGGTAVIVMAFLRATGPYHTRRNARANRITYENIPIVRPGASIELGFYPDLPDGTRFAIVKIAKALNLSLHRGRRAITVAWSDETFSPEVDNAINGKCIDISKRRVGEIFQEAFHYPLAVDPTQHTGRCVEKSDFNGMHDGRIVTCPHSPLPDRVYQVVVENHVGNLVEDLRVVIIGLQVVTVFLKFRPTNIRFSTVNSKAILALPEVIFSDLEISQILHFSKLIGLDYGELDVLRDRTSGRIYVVDVAKTPAGPPNVLNLADKLTSIRLMAQAFERAFLKT